MNELLMGLSQFHLTVGRVIKGNKADRYKYADLATVLDVIREPLHASGLVLTQTFESSTLVTTLWHTSGQSIESRMELPALDMRGMNAAQSLGSAISYCRRYALLALLNLAAEDDDGASSGPVGRPAAAAQAPTQAPARTLTPTEEIRQLQQRLNLPVDAVLVELQDLGANKVAELDADGVETLKTRLLDLAKSMQGVQA